eukprot:415155-Amphidinium_carterae.1
MEQRSCVLGALRWWMVKTLTSSSLQESHMRDVEKMVCLVDWLESHYNPVAVRSWSSSLLSRPVVKRYLSRPSS